jgi:hypothetical protein
LRFFLFTVARVVELYCIIDINTGTARRPIMQYPYPNEIMRIVPVLVQLPLYAIRYLV